MRALLGRRELLIVFGFAGLAVIGNFAGNRLLTQWIDPRPLGELYLFMNLAGWLTIPTASGYLFILRYWQEAKSHGLGRYLALAIGKGLAIQAVIAAIGIFVLSFFKVGVSSVGIGLALFMVCLGTAINQAFEPIQNMERRRVWAGVLQLCGAPLRSFVLLVGGLLLVSPTGPGLLKIQVIHSLGLAAITLAALGWLLRQHPVLPGPTIRVRAPGLSMGEFLAFAAPTLLGNLLGQASASAERWGLAKLVDPSATALFVLSLGLSSAAVTATTGMISTYFYPLITDKAVGSAAPLRVSFRYTARFLLSTSLILVLVVAAVAIGAPRLTPLLLGPKYAAVSQLLPWTTLGAGLFQLGQTIYIYPYVARDMLKPVVAYGLSRVAYIAALVLTASSSPALHFSRLYAAGQALYVVLMTGLAVWLVARESGTSPVSSGPPALATLPEDLPGATIRSPGGDP